MLNLPAFWESLPQDAELKRRYEQPPKHTAKWWQPAGFMAGGAILTTTDRLVLGVLIIVAGLCWGGWLLSQVRAAERARARWSRSYYCRRCPKNFLREDGWAVSSDRSATEADPAA